MLPPSLREEHLAWYVIDAVAELDLSAFYAAHREDGHGQGVADALSSHWASSIVISARPQAVHSASRATVAVLTASWSVTGRAGPSTASSAARHDASKLALERRGRDSNPRCAVRRTTVFEAVPFASESQS